MDPELFKSPLEKIDSTAAATYGALRTTWFSLAASLMAWTTSYLVIYPDEEDSNCFRTSLTTG